jgi:hypothetical protein
LGEVVAVLQSSKPKRRVGEFGLFSCDCQPPQFKGGYKSDLVEFVNTPDRFYRVEVSSICFFGKLRPVFSLVRVL